MSAAPPMPTRADRRHPTRARRGATLVELVAVIVVLAVSVPVSVAMLRAQSAGSADAVQFARASALTTAVCEQIIADVASSDESLGFEALGDSAAYLETAGTGLYDRLATATDAYEAMGFGYTVEIGPAVDSGLSVSESESENIYRLITVRVTAPMAATASVEIPTALVVTETTP